LNAALLKVVEKDGTIGRLSKQFESESQILAPFSSLSCEPAITCRPVHLPKTRAELKQSWIAREQDAVALNQARNAQRDSEEAHQRNIEDLAKLGRAISTVMAGLGVSLGPVMPEMLVEEFGRLPEVVRELELATARRVVHRVLAMFESHYQGLDSMALSGGWAPSISDAQCDDLEEDCASFARDMADTALKDWELLPQDAPEDSEAPDPSS
jgi:hypothetical protein